MRLPNDIVLCNFSYQEIQENYHTPISTTRNQLLGSPVYGDAEVVNINKGMLLPKIVSSSQQIFSTQKYVDEVNMRDGTKIKYPCYAVEHRIMDTRLFYILKYTGI